MKKITLLLLLFITTISYSQVVNGVNLKDEVDTFEVWAFKKPFSNKESLFVNYGQDKFRPHYYDHKTQIISDDDKNKFSKGKWLQLSKYLKSQGWVKTDERSEKIGDVEGRVITFEKTEN